MNRILKIPSYLIGLSLIIICSCKKPDSPDPNNIRDIKIEAVVPDFVYENKKEFYLDARPMIDLNLNRKIYIQWSCIVYPTSQGKPDIELPESHLTRVDELSFGKYRFQLNARDDFGNLARKEFDIEVLEDTLRNIIPKADAGPDQLIYLPKDEVRLNGTASFSLNPAGRNFQFKWSEISKPAGSNGSTLEGVNDYYCDVWSLIAGTYLFKLDITNEYGRIASDTVEVKVLPDTLAGKSIIFDDPVWERDKGIHYGEILLSINKQSLFQYRNENNTKVRVWDENKKQWSEKDQYQWYVTYTGTLIIFYPWNIDPAVYEKELGKKAKVLVNFL